MQIELKASNVSRFETTPIPQHLGMITTTFYADEMLVQTDKSEGEVLRVKNVLLTFVCDSAYEKDPTEGLIET